MIVSKLGLPDPLAVKSFLGEIVTGKKKNKQSLPRIRRRWLLLAVSAGAINAGGFLACQRFVTHVTGFATHFGLDFAQGHWLAAASMLVVPGFFLFGAFISGLLMDVQVHKGRAPRSDIVMLLMALSLTIVAVAGTAGKFGTFGTPLEVGRDFIFLALLCLASGLQNAVVTSSTGAVIRTTHLTGMTTDLGIGLARVASRVGEGVTQRGTINNWLRVGLIGSFIVGASFGAWLFGLFDYGAFLFPAFVSASMIQKTINPAADGIHHF